jgi:hypothetical protein
MCEVSQHGIEGAGEDWAAYDASSQSRVLAEAQVVARAVATRKREYRLRRESGRFVHGTTACQDRVGERLWLR